MASSRIFVKGLPPTFTEGEFKRYFSSQSPVTDVKIFPNRRIGYVGYKSAADAQQAVKYFNKTFIRMSRIAVELARPIDETQSVARQAPTAKKELVKDEPKIDTPLKRKREGASAEERDPKLQEFLDAYQPKNKKKAWESETTHAELSAVPDSATDPVLPADDESDEEYAVIPKKVRHSGQSPVPDPSADEQPQDTGAKQPDLSPPINAPEQAIPDQADETAKPPLSDADWLRSRTSRLLGVLDEDEEGVNANAPVADQIEEGMELDDHESPSNLPTPPAEEVATPEQPRDVDVEAVRSSMRLFIRNLPYNVQPGELREEFSPYGHIEEVHIPQDIKNGVAKGFAYIQFINPDAAEQAFIEKDGQIFQGRLIHIIPARARRTDKLDDFELSKLPLKKQQQIKKKRDAASTTFNWNALYLNSDAVLSSVAERLGIAKSEALDPTSSDAAVKQAHAETHIIQETKSFFQQHGVDLDSFKSSQRGDSAILIKNIPYDCSRDELKRLFEEHGEIKRFLMPPSGVIAIVEFMNTAQCRLAFGAVAYRKMKGSVLFLEKAPKDLFSGSVQGQVDTTTEGVSKVSASDLKNPDYKVPDTVGSATLFVRNLNFTTSSQLLTDTFKPLDGFISARVKTKTDPKKPGQVLSMGFGFLEFRTASEAQAALLAMDGYSLEGHKLQIRASHKGADAAEERRKADAEKRANAQTTKIVIRNLPFEATKKDVRALFGAYGQLRSVRVPQKMDRTARGFGFAEFTTAKEAQNAVEALRDTHLLGRRLVIEFAEAEAEDAEAEIEKMQQKVGSQVNKVALQKLTSGGRKKFTTAANEEDE